MCRNCFGILFFNIKFYKTLYNPATIFTMLWAIILLLYSLHLYGLKYAEFDNLLVLVSGIFFYNIGCFLACITKIRIRYGGQKNVSYTINERLFFLFAMISAVILWIGAKYNMENISLTVQKLRYGGEMNISYSYIVARDFFAVPIVFAVICVFFASTILEKLNIKYLVAVVLLVILDVLALFEQLCVYGFVVCVLFTLIVCFSEKNDKNRQVFNTIKKYTKYLIGIVFILLYVLSMFRTSSLIKRIYNYVADSVVLFSMHMSEFKELGQASIVSMYTYGISSIQGLLRHLVAVLETFGFSSDLFDSASYTYATYFALPRTVSSEGGTYNSFVTTFMYFYKDLGLLGVLIFSAVYGYINFSVYKSFRKNQNIYSLAVYIYFVIGIFFTYIQSPFTDKKFAFALILLLCLKKRDGNNESVSGDSDISS